MRISVVSLAFGVMLATGCGVLPNAENDRARAAAHDDVGDPPLTPDSPSSDTRTPTSSRSRTPTPSPTHTATLPGGGSTVLPHRRLVGFAGGRSPAFGRLSIDHLGAAADQIAALGAKYTQDGRRILPVFELIAVVAHPSPAADGLYRTHEPDDVIRTYLSAARAHDALLLLNIQPGRADFIDEVRRLEYWLREPDVGLALDPEWAVGPGEVPGDVYGSTTGAELNEVAAYLSELVRSHDLPQKVMVFHQVHPSVVENEAALKPHPGVLTIKSVDGIGARADKEATWRTLMRTKPGHVRSGFKLFFDEDTELGPLMTPPQVLALTPTPDYVLYE